jgi:hypothetical protein
MDAPSVTYTPRYKRGSSDRGRAKLVEGVLSVFLFSFPAYLGWLSQRRVKNDPWGLVIR